MKRVIIALTTAAVLCGASASFAQTPVSSKGMGGERLVIFRIERQNAPAAAGVGVTHEAVVNGKTIKFRVGASEVRQRLALKPGDLSNLRATLDGTPCILRTSPALLRNGAVVDGLTFRLSGAKPNASAMGATKTMGAGKPFRCDLLVTTRRP